MNSHRHGMYLSLLTEFVHFSSKCYFTSKIIRCFSLTLYNCKRSSYFSQYMLFFLQSAVISYFPRQNVSIHMYIIHVWITINQDFHDSIPINQHSLL